MKVILTRITENPILAIEDAASNCYDSKPSSDGKIMRHCINSGHTSVTEFCNFTFHVEGVSRALLAQITRHRHSSFSVRSQRYVTEDKFEYVTPKSIANNPNFKKNYEQHMRNVQDYYNAMIELGVPTEDARMVLPNACCTEFEVSMNFRALMNFMHERLCTCSQWEIRQLAKLMRDAVVAAEPAFAPYLVPKCESGKIRYCSESPKRSCGRQPLAKDILALMYKGEFNGYN